MQGLRDHDQCLPRSARSYWLVSAMVSWAVIAGAVTGCVLWFRWPIPWWLPLAGWVMIVLLELALLGVRYRHYRYRISDLELSVTRGRLVRRHITTAISQVLHTELSQGPIQRLYALVTFKAQQASGSVDVGPITAEEAERLRQLVLEASSRKIDT